MSILVYFIRSIFYESVICHLLVGYFYSICFICPSNMPFGKSSLFFFWHWGLVWFPWNNLLALQYLNKSPNCLPFKSAIVELEKQYYGQWCNKFWLSSHLTTRPGNEGVSRNSLQREGGIRHEGGQGLSIKQPRHYLQRFVKCGPCVNPLLTYNCMWTLCQLYVNCLITRWHYVTWPNF